MLTVVPSWPERAPRETSVIKSRQIVRLACCMLLDLSRCLFLYLTLPLLLSHVTSPSISCCLSLYLMLCLTLSRAATPSISCCLSRSGIFSTVALSLSPSHAQSLTQKAYRLGALYGSAADGLHHLSQAHSNWSE